MINHEHFMNMAYQEALKALDEGEVPIGAVIVQNQTVIGRGYNRIEKLNDPTAHAEIIAITAASESCSSWRLDNATLYVTLEPCIMCLGAIMHARIPTVVYGAPDARMGAIDSHFFRQEIERSYQRFPETIPNIMAEATGQLLKTFFVHLRKKS